MAYRPAQAPRVLLRIVAGVVLGLFALVLAAEWVPRLHNAYLWYHIEKCEAAHSLLPSDQVVNSGFDAGGWSVTGDNTRKRAFVQCVRDRLSLQSQSDDAGPHPVIVVSWHSARISPKVHVSYSAGISNPPAPH